MSVSGGECFFCNDYESDVTACDECGRLFCSECEPYRDDNAPINLCEFCIVDAAQARKEQA
jgi:hypothetical protein